MLVCHILCGTTVFVVTLTLTVLIWIVWRVPNNASRWQMALNLAIKGLNEDCL